MRCLQANFLRFARWASAAGSEQDCCFQMNCSSRPARLETDQLILQVREYEPVLRLPLCLLTKHDQTSVALGMDVSLCLARITLIAMSWALLFPNPRSESFETISSSGARIWRSNAVSI